MTVRHRPSEDVTHLLVETAQLGRLGLVQGFFQLSDNKRAMTAMTKEVLQTPTASI